MANKNYEFQQLEDWTATISPSKSEDPNFCYKPDTAYLILNTGLDFIDLVVHKDQQNKWRVSEYLTGASIHYRGRETPNTRRDVVPWAINYMRNIKQENIVASIRKHNRLNDPLPKG